MSRKEIKKFVIKTVGRFTEQDYTIKGRGMDAISNTVADYVIKHEQDTLKEFVEYCKNNIILTVKLYNNTLYESNKDIGSLIAETLEDFIKERDKNA